MYKIQSCYYLKSEAGQGALLKYHNVLFAQAKVIMLSEKCLGWAHGGCWRHDVPRDLPGFSSLLYNLYIQYNVTNNILGAELIYE